jgi:hypothetical protein
MTYFHAQEPMHKNQLLQSPHPPESVLLYILRMPIMINSIFLSLELVGMLLVMLAKKIRRFKELNQLISLMFINYSKSRKQLISSLLKSSKHEDKNYS